MKDAIDHSLCNKQYPNMANISEGWWASWIYGYFNDHNATNPVQFGVEESSKNLLSESAIYAMKYVWNLVLSFALETEATAALGILSSKDEYSN